jgi:TolB-like protein/tetratricopeptide (TPR) repeat protein
MLRVSLGGDRVAEIGGEEQGAGARAEAFDAFISYASPDAAVANAVVRTLELNAIKCWIAPRDVPAGAPYADGIIRAINSSRAIVLVLSESAISSPHVGKEVERASSKRRPIIVFRTDATPLPPALEYFLSESQWIEAGAGGTDAASAKLVEAVQRLIAHPASANSDRDAHSVNPGAAVSARATANQRWNRPLAAVIAVVAALCIYMVVDKFWLANHPRTTVAESAPASDAAHVGAVKSVGDASATAPPPHSIAVLPFVNMSGDPKQEYFSDGLSEELLNSLVAIPDLQVAARTSSFTFKGTNVDVADIARKLHVGAVLEGSVRKDGNQVRITAQLINAATGFHLWSHTYDRDLKNVLTLQAEIATAVTMALKATLLADAAAIIEIGGTQIPAAFDAYLRGKTLERKGFNKENALARMALFEEAIRLDPKFAKALVGAALVQAGYATNYSNGPELRSWFKKARENAERAISLAPELGEAHVAMGMIWERGYLDFVRAQTEFERALALSPNDNNVLMRSGRFFATIGRTEEGLAKIRRAIAMDQLNPQGYALLSLALSDAQRYREAIDANNRALQIDFDSSDLKNARGMNYLMLGELQSARESCETKKRDWQGWLCLAILYDRLHRRADAETERAAMQAEFGEGAAYQMAEIYAQWGEIPKALDWLEAAYRLPDAGIISVKLDPLVDPLRKEPRFREIERKLNFPN